MARLKDKIAGGPGALESLPELDEIVTGIAICIEYQWTFDNITRIKNA